MARVAVSTVKLGRTRADTVVMNKWRRRILLVGWSGLALFFAANAIVFTDQTSEIAGFGLLASLIGVVLSIWVFVVVRRRH